MVILSWYATRVLFFSGMSGGGRRSSRSGSQGQIIILAVGINPVQQHALTLLAPYLTPENGDELLVAAVHKSKAQIEQLLAERFPQPDLPARLLVGHVVLVHVDDRDFPQQPGQPSSHGRQYSRDRKS